MLQEKILKTIQDNNLIEKNDKIIIGVSGGPDSMCLLDILYCLKESIEFEIAVCHINHGIRKEADSETAYVENYCKQRKIPCFVKRIKVEELAKEKKIGTEEMGRKIRYEFFEETLAKIKANKIATAHTANDNAETVLMNIMRGSAISGLKGIEINRKENINLAGKEKFEITYIRPLRETTRQEVEEYCEQKELQPKIDKSNFENTYTRNKIRNNLIPYLKKEYNPNIIQTINRLSDLAKDDEEYFSKIVAQEYETLKIGENEKEIILDLKRFNTLEKVIKTRILLYTINEVTGTTQGIAKIHLEDIIKLCQNNVGNKYLTPHKNIKIFVKKGKIFITSKVSIRNK